MMNYFLSLATDFLKGKKVYSQIIRAFNIIMTASITSWIFTKFYFPYKLIPITDVNAIYEFFIKGAFLPPLIIFLLVHFIFFFIGESIFSLKYLHYSSKWQKSILKFKVKARNMKKLSSTLNNLPLVTIPVRFNMPILLKYFEFFKRNIKPLEIEKGRKALEVFKTIANTNFKLVFKAIVVVTIYFATLHYFGWLLYSVTILILLVLLPFFFTSYLFLSMVPTVLYKMNYETQAFLESQEAMSPSSKQNSI